MKKTALALLFIVLIFSCSRPEPTYYSEISIHNETDHTIEIIAFLHGEIFDKIYLKKNDEKEFDYTSEGGWVKPPPFMGDSALVLFNDTTIITHYRINYPYPERNIFESSNWDERIDGDNHYYYYKFREADYIEATNSK